MLLHAPFLAAQETTGTGGPHQAVEDTTRPWGPRLAAREPAPVRGPRLAEPSYASGTAVQEALQGGPAATFAPARPAAQAPPLPGRAALYGYGAAGQWSGATMGALLGILLGANVDCDARGTMCEGPIIQKKDAAIGGAVLGAMILTPLAVNRANGRAGSAFQGFLASATVLGGVLYLARDNPEYLVALPLLQLVTVVELELELAGRGRT